MELIHINPYVRYAKLLKNELLEPALRLCYDCRLFFIVSGNGELELNGSRHPIQTDTAIFLPPGTEYAIHCVGPLTFYVLNFDLSVNYTHIESSLGTPSPAASDRSKILTEDAPQQFSQPFILDNVTLPKQLVEICQIFQTREHFYKELTATDYDIKTISWKTGFNSVSYFIKTFHAKLGMTPLEYRKRLW